MKRFVSRSAFLWIWSKCDEKKIEEKKIRSEKISNEYTLQQKKERRFEAFKWLERALHCHGIQQYGIVYAVRGLWIQLFVRHIIRVFEVNARRIERKEGERAMFLPANSSIAYIYCVFAFNRLDNLSAGCFYINNFIWVCVYLFSPKSLTTSLRLLAYTDKQTVSFKFQFDDDDDGHKTYTVWILHSYHSYRIIDKPTLFMWQLILCTLLRPAMKCLSGIVLHSFKYFVSNMFADSIAKFTKYTLLLHWYVKIWAQRKGKRKQKVDGRSIVK